MRERQAHLPSGFDDGEMAQLFEYLDRLDKVSGKLKI